MTTETTPHVNQAAEVARVTSGISSPSASAAGAINLDVILNSGLDQALGFVEGNGIFSNGVTGLNSNGGKGI